MHSRIAAAVCVLGTLAANPAGASAPGTQLVLDTRDDFCGYLTSRLVVGFPAGGRFEPASGWDADELALDPSGLWLAERDYPNIVVVDLVSGRVRTFRGDAALQWSARGSVLLKSGDERSSLIRNGRFMARFNRSFTSLAPNGDAIAGPGRRARLLIATQSRGWRVRRLGTREPENFSWSPAGRTLAYTSSGNVLHLLHTRSLKRRALHLPRGDVNHTAWSPDGRWLAIDLTRHDRPTTVVVSVRRGRVRATLHAESDEWSPTGDDLTMLGRRTRLVSPSGRTRWRSRISNGRWSPDGRLLIGSVRRSEHDVWAVSRRGTRMIQIVRVHGRPLPGGYDTPLWSADGSAVLTGGRSGRGVFVVDPWTAVGRLLTRVEEGPEPIGFIHASWGVLSLMHHALHEPRARAADC